jgi:hypothetical protein
VQIVYGNRRGARRMEHVGSAHDERALEALKDDAAQWLASGQHELQVDLEMGSGMQPVTVGPRRLGRASGAAEPPYRAYIDGWNQRAHPFVWTKTAEHILAKADRKKTSDAPH